MVFTSFPEAIGDGHPAPPPTADSLGLVMHAHEMPTSNDILNAETSVFGPQTQSTSKLQAKLAKPPQPKMVVTAMSDPSPHAGKKKR